MTHTTSVQSSLQKDNFLIKIQEYSDNTALILATNLLNGTRFIEKIDSSGLNQILLNRIKDEKQNFSIKSTESTFDITVQVESISHTVSLKMEYSRNSEELKDVWSFFNKLKNRIEQLEKKQPKTKRITIPLDIPI